MSFAPETLDASHAACRRTARRSGSSFYPCFFLLPRPKRRAMEALYAFLRHTDDLGDDPRPEGGRRAMLVEWRASLERALGGQWGLGDDPILPALAHAVREFRIPERCLHHVIDGVEMDLDGRRYETFDDLAVYCRRVASAVGLACIHVWGFRGDEALAPADACGIAFQLTNILRDLREDAARGRVYLPLGDLRACGYSPEELLAGALDARFDRLVRLEADRAQGFYHEAGGLFDCLDQRGRRIFGMMVSTYHRLLERIASRPREAFARRVRLGRLEKLWIAARWALLPPRRTDLP